MSTQIQRRRGTTAQHASFTGAIGETTIDTDKEVVVVHDGTQVGGYPLMRENASNSALALGSAATPSLKFTGDTNTGIYSPGADQVGISTGGTVRLTTDTTAITSTLPVVHPLGAVGTPSITFTGDLNTGVFSPGADTLALVTAGSNRLHITSAGLVGIGTSSPSQTLSVVAPSNAQAIGIWNRTSDNTYGAINFKTSDGATDQSIIQNAKIGTNGAQLSFYTKPDGGSAAEKLTIDSTGRVGIGTTSPAEAFTLGSGNAQITSGQLTVGVTSSSGLQFINDGTLGTLNSIPLILRTASTERARIDTSGRLLVGTSTSLASTALVQAYKSSGTLDSLINSASIGNAESVKFVTNAGGRISELGVYKHSGITNSCSYLYFEQQNGVGQYFWTDDSGNFRISGTSTNIGTTGGTVVGTQTSDERLKNILGPVEYGLDTIKQIEPIRYSLKTQPDIEQLGFIAQQVQPLVPQSVFDTKEHIEGEPEDAPTKFGMEYVALIPVLVNAIKELSAEVDALKAQLQ